MKFVNKCSSYDLNTHKDVSSHIKHIDCVVNSKTCFRTKHVYALSPSIIQRMLLHMIYVSIKNSLCSYKLNLLNDPFYKCNERSFI